MSICASPYRSRPSTRDYARMLKIKEEDRCVSCDGLGIIRARYSSPGHTDKDWRKCWRCRGTGIKTKNMVI